MKNVKVKALVWWTLIFFLFGSDWGNLENWAEKIRFGLRIFVFAWFSDRKDEEVSESWSWIPYKLSIQREDDQKHSTLADVAKIDHKTTKMFGIRRRKKKIWKSWPTTPRTSSFPPSRTSLLSNLLRKWLTWMSWTLLRFIEWNFMQKWTKSRGNFVEATNRMNEKGKKMFFFYIKSHKS